MFFFFQKNSERGAGGLAQSEIPLSEKNEIVFGFFSQKIGDILGKKEKSSLKANLQK